jgi:hypothetical protein
VTQKVIRELTEFPALVVAAFVVRNAGVLIVLSGLALVALGAE